jgi:2-hydroxychromene-2-carboxylate isomerase
MNMATPVEFYFDFSSPYGYLASTRIDAMAARHGREVAWRPFMLGAVFKLAGTAPLTQVPLKGDYSVRDFKRCARLYGVPFAMPAKFPVNTIVAARAYYWLMADKTEQARPFARAVLDAYFVHGRDISERDVVGEIAAARGIDRGALLAGVEAATAKEQLKAVTDEAINIRGVFGSPFVFVDGEPFWGSDRLDMVDRWLATGGW